MALIHRYLGLVLGLVFVVWSVSGIAMMYARDMPGLTPQARLDRSPALDMNRVWMTPSQAAQGAGLSLIHSGQVTLLTVMDRPAYRFAGSDTVTVFADTGEALIELGEAGAVKIASSFTNLPRERIHHAGLLAEPDQWTIAQRGQMPLHKIRVDDDVNSQLYISPKTAEVVVLTTRRTRALAWVAAIPHLFYFTPLRLNAPLWRVVVLCTAVLGTLLTLTGIVLGILQFTPSRPFQWRRIGSYTPDSGWMRWHCVTGVIFGAFMLTWVLSGILLEPSVWAAGRGTGDRLTQALSDGALDLEAFPEIEPKAWDEALEGRAAKEVDFVSVQGDPYYLVHGAERKPLLISPNRAAAAENLFDVVEQHLEIKREPFPTESLISHVRERVPDAPVVESALLSEYDSYYYAFDGARSLPVLRIKFGDPGGTWFYIDPYLSQVMGRVSRVDRVERWVYKGFHCLDFPFWYYNRPLRDIAVIALSLGCIGSSVTGLFIGVKRLISKTRRRDRH